MLKEVVVLYEVQEEASSGGQRETDQEAEEGQPAPLLLQFRAHEPQVLAFREGEVV